MPGVRIFVVVAKNDDAEPQDGAEHAEKCAKRDPPNHVMGPDESLRANLPAEAGGDPQAEHDNQNGGVPDEVDGYQPQDPREAHKAWYQRGEGQSDNEP